MSRYSRQRYFWDTLACSLLLTVLASCLIPQSKAAVEEVGCERHINCSSCIAIESSQLNCTWLQCSDKTLTQCTNSTSTHPGCTTVSENGTCTDFPVGTTTASHSTTVTSPTGNTTNSTSTEKPILTTTTIATTSVITAKTGTSALIPTTKPSPHKASFDAASFIGGIVLVLGLQAVIFFLYKFCKSKEQNYNTL
ncbi:sialomucin core protein 24 [Thamnophis elegans]|uniref:sialomucin core protein 24 n=1 Tax=Thamnophis elegans TaxID=35005 RepID=UPI001378C316|nr:sialomucin core protein 24 [Thamnophis elegans]